MCDTFDIVQGGFFLMKKPPSLMFFSSTVIFIVFPQICHDGVIDQAGRAAHKSALPPETIADKVRKIGLNSMIPMEIDAFFCTFAGVTVLLPSSR